MTPISLGIFAAANQSAAAGTFESIATVSVGSGGSSSIDFTSIPGTYAHLQLRVYAQTNRGTFGTDFGKLIFNSDSGSNYSRHYIGGDGGSSLVGASTSTAYATTVTTGTTTGGSFGGVVIDILDYANTNKYKTVRTLGGNDLNGSVGGYAGEIYLVSGSWRNTNAVTSITITPNSGTAFTQYSHFALYGIKAA